MSKIVQLQDNNGNDILPIGYAMGGVKMDLLWTNPNPGSSFDAQTVSLDLSDYSIICITTRGYASTYISTSFILKDLNGFIQGITDYSANRYAHDFREITSSDSGIVFGTGYIGSSTYSNACIPQKIFGIKTSYVVPTEVHGLQYVEVE